LLDHTPILISSTSTHSQKFWKTILLRNYNIESGYFQHTQKFSGENLPFFLLLFFNFSPLRFSFSPISQGYKIGTSIGTFPKIPGIFNFIKEILVKNMGEEGGLCNAF
jgi:hypothetical protein